MRPCSCNLTIISNFFFFGLFACLLACLLALLACLLALLACLLCMLCLLACLLIRCNYSEIILPKGLKFSRFYGVTLPGFHHDSMPE